MIRVNGAFQPLSVINGGIMLLQDGSLKGLIWLHVDLGFKLAVSKEGIKTLSTP